MLISYAVPYQHHICKNVVHNEAILYLTSLMQTIKYGIYNHSQREPAEEALKCNNLNLDQAMGKSERCDFDICSY